MDSIRDHVIDKSKTTWLILVGTVNYAELQYLLKDKGDDPHIVFTNVVKPENGTTDLIRQCNG